MSDQQQRKQYRVGDGHTRLVNENGEGGQSPFEWSETPSPTLKECLDELTERLSKGLFVGVSGYSGNIVSPKVEVALRISAEKFGKIDDVSLQVVDDEKQRAYDRSRADLAQKRRDLHRRRR